MGSGVSSPRISPLHSVFINADVTKGSKSLVKDETLRESFILFIKSSVWLDTLVHYFPTGKTALTHEDRLVNETKNILYAFKQPKEKRISLEGVCAHAESRPPGALSVYSILAAGPGSIRSGRTVSPKKYTAPEAHSESYVNIEESSMFPTEELLGVFLNILCPIYLSSDFYRRYLKHGIEHGIEAADEVSFSFSPPVVNKLALRAQELLLGSAAFFDESVLHDHLLNVNWVDAAATAMDGLNQCVTLFDVSLPEPRIVYANRAFSQLTGYSTNEIVQHNMSLLKGENTDKAQADLITSALHSTALSKFAATHYCKNGKSFLNLLTMRSCGKYAVCVHFNGTKTAKLDQLKAVDDLVVYLTCLLTPPPAPAHAIPPAPASPSPRVSRGATLMRQISKLVPSPLQHKHKMVNGSGKGSNKSSVGGSNVVHTGGQGGHGSGGGSSNGSSGNNSSDKASLHSLQRVSVSHNKVLPMNAGSGSGKSSDGTIVGVMNRENSGGTLMSSQTVDTVPAMPLISSTHGITTTKGSVSISASSSIVSTLTASSSGINSVATSPTVANTNNTNSNNASTTTSTNTSTTANSNYTTGIAAPNSPPLGLGCMSTSEYSSKKQITMLQFDHLTTRTEKM